MKNNDSPAGIFQTLLDAIDKRDWDSLRRLLSDDTSYEVSGFRRFEGRHAVMDYYQNIRPIESGTHSVDSIVFEGHEGVCFGTFTGVKKDGEVISVMFADRICLENFRIKQRRVYFCKPSLA